MERFRHAKVSQKLDQTVVTDADRAVERILSAELVAAFPGDGVVGEEGAKVLGGGHTWYIDPIDGTNAFVEGLTHWGPSVGRVGPKGVELGATWFPRMQEFFFAGRGLGAWRDGERLPALVERTPRRSDVVFLPSRFHNHFVLDFPCKARSLGSVASHLALVAGGGAIAAFIPAGWSLWDALAGLALLEEVGGVAITLQGERLDPLSDRGLPFVAGTPEAASFFRDRIHWRTGA